MKIYLTAIIRAKKEYQDEVRALLENMVVKTREESACELYNLHQSLDNKNLFTFYEIWTSDEGLAKHNEQPYIKAFAAVAREKLEEEPTIILTTLL